MLLDAVFISNIFSLTVAMTLPFDIREQLGVFWHENR